ncbi:putative alcohol dehydrogenase [Astrocystis sublimbata]|nr:putative alcohol dehydrogenase [Astrocystis sublimbata]
MNDIGVQTAILQASTVGASTVSGGLQLEVSTDVPIPELPSPDHVLVRVLAVALNPTDYKSPIFFPAPGQPVGSDFCGLVVKCGGSRAAELQPGTRVCGAVFPYAPDTKGARIASGAFSEWVVADSRLLVRVPPTWNDLQGAALGGIGWGTVALALSDKDALDLQGSPSKPADTPLPVVVYGGATATGTMACQLLQLSGYKVIAIASPQSARLVRQYGASGTTAYTSPNCVDDARTLAGSPIRHVLDCITSPESAEICFSAIARTGGRYACLEALNELWRTRKLIHVKEVMGYEGLGVDTQFGDTNSIYTRPENAKLSMICQNWRIEIQRLVDAGLLKSHPVREIPCSWEGILHGLGLLKNGEVRGQKLVVRIATAPTDSA